jgi:hypothetical protein
MCGVSVVKGVFMKSVIRNATLLGASIFAFATPANAGISFSPRFFLYFDNSSQRQSGLSDVAQLDPQADADLSDALTDFYGVPIDVTSDNPTSSSINNQVVFPMIGGALTFGLDKENRTSLSVSLLYGEANSKYRSINSFDRTVTVADTFVAEDLFVQTAEGKAKVKRWDLELTLQHRLNERFALLGGLRYERNTSRGNFVTTTAISENANNLLEALFDDGDFSFGVDNSTGVLGVNVKDNIYSARFGGAAFVPIGQRSQVYVNGLLHLTYFPGANGTSRFVVPEVLDEEYKIKIPSETLIGPDIAVGYLHRFSDKVGLDFRYRGIFYFPISGNKKFNDPRVNHGINAGLTFNF